MPKTTPTDSKLDHDLKTLARFVEVYCQSKHELEPKSAFTMKMEGLAQSRQPPMLCAACQKLLSHAWVKRSHCPMEPKPACKHCPVHCYHPDYRARIREVMAYSGKKIVLSGRLDYLYHLLF